MLMPTPQDKAIGSVGPLAQICKERKWAHSIWSIYYYFFVVFLAARIWNYWEQKKEILNNLSYIIFIHHYKHKPAPLMTKSDIEHNDTSNQWKLLWWWFYQLVHASLLLRVENKYNISIYSHIKNKLKLRLIYTGGHDEYIIINLNLNIFESIIQT